MIQDLSRDDLPETASTDICIIGAGVAGQTLAMRLIEYGIDVTLVDSGGRDFDPQTQALSDGDNVGEDYYPLDTARLRLFGGTAAIWGGRCAELDAIDFTKRDYIPYSGWPIHKDDLDPYYARAFAQLGLKRPGEGRLWPVIGREPPAFDPELIDTDLWCFDENGERFTSPSRGNLNQAKIMLNATLTNMDVNDQGEVKRITVNSLNGHTQSIEAKHFVLAAGAIESVRILMGAVPHRPKGLGNDYDGLGRYFMEHPHARGGQIVPNNLAHALMLLPRAIRVDGQRYAAYLRPSDALQRREGILNTSVSFAPRRHADGKSELFRSVTGKLKHELPSTKLWRSLYKGLKGAAIKGLEWTDPWSSVINMKANRGTLGLYAIVRAEQAPNPDSRVTLSNETDALGLRKAALDWRFSDLDKRSVARLMETLKSQFNTLGWGDVIPAEWLSDPQQIWATDPLISAHPIGGYHHMGGTRMSDDPMTGIVDKHCRVHASPNLSIASSSVFPTGGWANPTVTIMALSERLADHLATDIFGKTAKSL